jgi:hypothetical protein
MPLTDLQIDRYSRQIIVGGIGGRGQERLLGSSLVIVGDEAEIETPLAYFLGAGVGRIRVLTADDSAGSLVGRMRDRNPDVTVGVGDDIDYDANLLLAVIGSTKSLAIAEQAFERHPQAPAIIARLDKSPRIAVIPSCPPCPRCADANLLAPFGAPASTTDFVSMFATNEALKLLAGFVEKPNAQLIEFEGYESRTLPLKTSSRCACGAAHHGNADGR